MRFKSRCHASCRGFTLLEIILVMLVIAVMMGLAMEGYSGVAQASAVTTGAAMLSDALTEARSSAMAQNLTVEVRIYEISRSSGTAPAYAAAQLHWLRPDGTTPPVARPAMLSSWVAIDVPRSSLIGANTRVPTPDAADPMLDGNTRVFHFLPDGSTDLDPGTKWFLTVRAASQSDPAHFPANWACVTVDAANGRAQVLRP